jgi:hypothetical protein
MSTIRYDLNTSFVFTLLDVSVTAWLVPNGNSTFPLTDCLIIHGYSKCLHDRIVIVNLGVGFVKIYNLVITPALCR